MGGVCKCRRFVSAHADFSSIVIISIIRVDGIMTSVPGSTCGSTFFASTVVALTPAYAPAPQCHFLFWRQDELTAVRQEVCLAPPFACQQHDATA